jgi:Spy/CpxP family protein refolding chaperone
MKKLKSSPSKKIRRLLYQGIMLSLALGSWVGAQPSEGPDGRLENGRQFGPPPEGHRGGPGGPGIESVNPQLLRELNLSSEQQRKMKDVNLTSQKRKIQLQSEKAIAELDLKNILSTFPVNVTEAMKLGEKVADVERKLIMLKVEAWSQFLVSLTAEQHKKLMEIRENLKEKRNTMREAFKKSGKNRKSEN